MGLPEDLKNYPSSMFWLTPGELLEAIGMLIALFALLWVLGAFR